MKFLYLNMTICFNMNFNLLSNTFFNNVCVRARVRTCMCVCVCVSGVFLRKNRPLVCAIAIKLVLCYYLQFGTVVPTARFSRLRRREESPANEIAKNSRSDATIRCRKDAARTWLPITMKIATERSGRARSPRLEYYGREKVTK